MPATELSGAACIDTKIQHPSLEAIAWNARPGSGTRTSRSPGVLRQVVCADIEGAADAATTGVSRSVNVARRNDRRTTFISVVSSYGGQRPNMSGAALSVKAPLTTYADIPDKERQGCHSCRRAFSNRL